MFSGEESWKMTETEKVVAIIKEVECWRLGYWDGCCCSEFSVRSVNVDIACGKGREKAVRISGGADHDAETLKPIMAEVMRQVEEQSGRGPGFAQYINEVRIDGGLIGER